MPLLSFPLNYKVSSQLLNVDSYILYGKENNYRTKCVMEAVLALMKKEKRTL